MNTDYILNLAREAMQTALLLSAPALVAALVVGFLTSMLQAVTSIKDMTMGLVLKILAISGALLVCGNWMMHLAIKHTKDVFDRVEMLGH
jgi:flagellar biosynthetic protein FliQ